MEENKDNREVIGSQSSEAVWNKELLLIFYDVCIEAIYKRLRPGSYFSGKGCKYVINTFKKRTGHSMTRLQLKNKWDGSRKEWRIWKKLNQQTGVEWDADTGTIKATNEWWTRTAKVIKGCEKFRKAGLDPELCKKLDTMFLHTVATGKYAWTPSSGFLFDSDVVGDGKDIVGLNYLIEGSDDSEDEPNFVQDVHNMENGADLTSHHSQSDGHCRGKRNKPESSKTDSGKKKKVNGLAAKISSQFERTQSSLESRSTEVTSRLRDEVGCSITEVMREVHSLPDIEIANDLHMFATVFFLSRNRREMWTTMGTLENKRIWLNKMFEKHGNEILG